MCSRAEEGTAKRQEQRGRTGTYGETEKVTREKEPETEARKTHRQTDRQTEEEGGGRERRGSMRE